LKQQLSVSSLKYKLATGSKNSHGLKHFQNKLRGTESKEIQAILNFAAVATLAINVKKFITRLSTLVRGRLAVQKFNQIQVQAINDITFFQDVKSEKIIDSKNNF
jgi:hypothetical protein